MRSQHHPYAIDPIAIQNPLANPVTQIVVASGAWKSLPMAEIRSSAATQPSGDVKNRKPSNTRQERSAPRISRPRECKLSTKLRRGADRGSSIANAISDGGAITKAPAQAYAAAGRRKASHIRTPAAIAPPPRFPASLKPLTQPLLALGTEAALRAPRTEFAG